MNKFKDKNSIFIVITGIIIAVGRFLLGKINENSDDGQYILIIMALVNYVALGFVLLFLYNDFCVMCKERILSSGMDTGLKRKCNFVISVFSGISLIIYLIFGILYITIFKTNDLNDVMSIIALALSIATNGLIEEYKNSYYKLVLKLAKFKFKKKVKK